MAMIDYGAILKKNGKIVNERYPYIKTNKIYKVDKENKKRCVRYVYIRND